MTFIRQLCLVVLSAGLCSHLSSCSDIQFTSKGAPNDRSVAGDKKFEGDQSAQDGPKASEKPGEFDASEKFLPTGKSLDLYVVMDNSTSLFSIPTSGQAGTDPSCKRFDALMDLIDEMRKKQTAGKAVRLSVVRFATQADDVYFDESVLEKTRDQLSEKLRGPLCFDGDRSPAPVTNYNRAISLALQKKNSLVLSKKMDVESVLFFSDGAANYGEEGELRKLIDDLNKSFPRRVWGLILGNAKILDAQRQNECILRRAGGSKLSAKECMEILVGSDLGKLIQVDSASELSSKLTELLK